MTKIENASELKKARLDALFDLSEWQKLLIHFDLAPDSFAFIPFFVPDSDWATLCQTALADFLRSSTEKKTLLVINLETPDELKNLASRFFDLKPKKKTGAVWISAPIPFQKDELTEWKAAWREGMARLNQYRNPFRERFDVPVLLVGAEWTKEITRDMAPDLWSVITISVYINPPAISTRDTSEIESPKVSNQFEGWRGVDPELALKEAERLRGQPNKEYSLARLLNRAANGFYARAKYRESLQSSTEAAEIIHRLLPKSSEDNNAELESFFADILNTRGIALVNQGKLSEAIAEYDKAIVIRERLVNEENRGELANDLAAAYTNKGVSLRNQGKLSEAVAEYDKAIVIYERLVNEENRSELANDLAAAYTNKGNALYSQGKLSEAIAEFDKAIVIRERLVNEENRSELVNDLAAAYMNKGNALANQGKLSEAIAEFDKAIVIRERLVNEENRGELANDLAAVYTNKGVPLANQGKLSEAVAEYDKAIVIYERLVNEENRSELANDLAAAYTNKGNALYSQGKLSEAIAEFDKAIVIYERLVNEENRGELANNLAMAYMNKGIALKNVPDLINCLDCFDKGIDWREKCLARGDDYVLPDYVKDLAHRIRLLINLEDYQRTANDILKAFEFINLLQEPDFPDYFKQRIGGEIGNILFQIISLPTEKREEIYKHAGESGEIIRQYVDDFEETQKSS